MSDQDRIELGVCTDAEWRRALPCDCDVISDAEFHELGLCLDGRSEGCDCARVRELPDA